MKEILEILEHIYAELRRLDLTDAERFKLEQQKFYRENQLKELRYLMAINSRCRSVLIFINFIVLCFISYYGYEFFVFQRLGPDSSPLLIKMAILAFFFVIIVLVKRWITRIIKRLIEDTLNMPSGI